MEKNAAKSFLYIFTSLTISTAVISSCASTSESNNPTDCGDKVAFMGAAGGMGAGGMGMGTMGGMGGMGTGTGPAALGVGGMGTGGMGAGGMGMGIMGGMGGRNTTPAPAPAPAADSNTVMVANADCGGDKVN